MKKLIILFLLLPSLLFSQVSPSKIERIADANTVFGTALSYGTYLVVQSNNKTYKIISVNGVAGTAKLSDLVLNTDYIEEGSVTSVSTAAANNGVTATWSMASPTPALTIGLGAITPSSVNGLTLTPLATGFTVAGGTTSKTLTVPLDASVSGTNTGDQTNITGNAATVTTNANLTGEVTSVGNAATLGSFTSSSLATALTNETGTGAAVFGTSPTLVTPALGTPASGVATNLTGTAAGLTAGNVTTNANLTGEVTSVGNAATVPNATVIGKVLTGFTSGAGTVAATDNILQAIQKLDGNSGTNANLTGEVTSVGNATTLGSFTSASLATALTNETGSGAAVFGTSPTFVTPALGTPASGVATNLTGTAPGLTAGNVTTNANLTGPITSVGNATSIASQTGTGTTFVMNTSPTLVTPNIGTPSAGVATNLTGTAAGLTAGNVTTNANLTGEVTSVGNSATVPNATVIGKVLTGFTSGAGTIAATDNILQAIQKLDGNSGTNANLTGPITSVGNATSIASQTGTGTTFVMNTSPVLVTPNIGTPSAGVATNLTGTAAGLTAGNVTTNANLTGVITSVGNATSIASQTGTGTMFVMNTSPTLVTPNIGTPSAGVATNLTGTAAGLTAGNVTTNANLTGEVTSVGNAATVPNATVIGKVLTGFTSGAGTVAATDNILQAIQKLDGNNGTNANLTGMVTSVGNATTVVTNANLTGAVTSSGNATSLGSFTSANLSSALSDESGTGAAIFANTPTLITPVLGVATATSINGNTITTGTGTLTLSAGKTLTASNTLTLTGTDASSIAFGTGGTVSYTANNLSVFAATTSAELAGVLSDETGTGLAVFGTTPTLTTPVINGTITGTTVIPLANGGTGSATQNWVDLTTIQTAAGAKTWSALGTFNAGISSTGNVSLATATGDVAIGGAINTSYKLMVYGKLKTNAINETSDQRYKKDIVTVPDALNKVLALRGVNYLWRTDEFPKNNFDTKLQLGVIAQEIEKIVPEVVLTDDKGFKSVEYSKLVALLIEAVKEQQKTIDQQKLDISYMKSDAGRIKKLEADMINLKLLIEGLNKDTKPVKKEK